ncbi:MAG: type II toxin-antitoxin system RelE/ParE family toxin [Bacteroidota bacterium]|nr:type II toxin-antitoxin system RelE/ParE family toxin [Bacteroidota bacterium]
MFRIELFETAAADLQEAYDWYEEQSIGLGERFIREVDDYLDFIGENPYQFPIQFSGRYHFALLRHFPFRIVYRIDTNLKSVYVSAVFHTSRDPKRF